MTHHPTSQAPVFVGIDLGTTQCAVAYTSPTFQPSLLPLSTEGTLPSILYFPETLHEPLEEITWDLEQLFPQSRVGAEAEALIQNNPARGCRYIKQRLAEPDWYIVIDDHHLDAETLTTLLLIHIRKMMESKGIGRIEGVVLSVPAQFSDQARRSTIKAAEQAGLPVLGLIHEPTAAALSKGRVYKVPSFQNENTDPIAGTTSQKLLVFDLGGGTLDISCVEDTGDNLKVIATVGNPNLGGQDFDNLLVEWTAHKIEEAAGFDPLMNPLGFESLRSEAESIRKQLSNSLTTEFTCSFGDFSYNERWNRFSLQQLCQPLLKQCRDLILNALEEANWSDSKDVQPVLAGGASRMPMVHDLLEAIFVQPLDHSLDPGASIALGASLFAVQSHKPEALTDEALFLPGQQLKEVMSHPLGLLLQRDGSLHYDPLFPKNSPLPSRTQASGFTTSSENQSVLDLMFSQNPNQSNLDLQGLLAGCRLSGIPPMAAGEANIQLNIFYNLNGMIEIEATEDKTNSTLNTHWLPPHELLSIWERTNTSNLVLLIDISKSMEGKPLIEAKYAVHAFLQSLQQSPLDKHHVGLISFGFEGVKLLSDLQDDLVVLKGIVAQLSAGGKTPLAEGLTKAQQVLSKVPIDEDKHVIVLSDGKPNSPDDAEESARRLREKGVRIITVGLGDGVDESFLRYKVCGHPEDYHGVEDPFVLPYTFQTLARSLRQS